MPWYTATDVTKKNSIKRLYIHTTPIFQSCNKLINSSDSSLAVYFTACFYRQVAAVLGRVRGPLVRKNKAKLTTSVGLSLQIILYSLSGRLPLTVAAL